MTWEPVVYDENGRTKWGWMVQHRAKLQMGDGHIDIGAFTYINARFGVVIEDDVEIGSHCSIYSHSTIDDKKGRVRVLRGARIGAHSIIMPGVTIGAYALVAACSFVNKDVPDGARVAGVPARPMRVRPKWATTEEALAFLDRPSHHD